MLVLKPDLNKFSSFCQLPAYWNTYFCQNMSLGSFSWSRRLTKWATFSFSSFWSFRALKSFYFCQKRCLSSFSQSGRLTKWVKFAFSSFCNFKAFKIPYFCQKMCLSTFSPSGKLTKWVKFAFSSFWSFRAHKMSNFQAHKMSQFSKSLIFVKRGLWVHFHQAGSSQNEQSLSFQEKSSKNCLWASNTLVQKPCSFKKILLPTSLMKHLNVRVLLANAVKSGRWVSHTFLQKPCFFSSFSAT